MAQQDGKRVALFTKFTNQLDILSSLKLLPSHLDLKYSPTYICPICAKPFGQRDLEQSSPNRLTLEDAPPDSLGGRKIALTCKKCNNTCGYQIDSHLNLGMNELDKKSLLPGSEIDLYFIRDGKKVNGQLTVGDDGLAKAVHMTKQNNPKLLNDYLIGVRVDTVKPSIEIEFKKSKLDQRKLGLALLKTAYVLTFAKFGYTFLMDKGYDRIREQLLHPEKDIYPLNFWTSKPFEQQHEGVHLLLNDGCEGFFCVFPLVTKLQTRRFGVYIPALGIPIEQALKRLDTGNGFSLRLDRAEGDFLGDSHMIREIERWNRRLITETMGLFLY